MVKSEKLPVIITGNITGNNYPSQH